MRKNAVQLRRLILMQFVSVIFIAKLWLLSCQLFKTDMVGFVAFIAKPEGLHIEIDVFITTAFLHTSNSYSVVP